jgi:DNA-binding response OmpR family regulator/HPt (histidine-containing phosphotransfer) domain-containing protein
MKILLIEDDTTIIAALTHSLSVYHYVVDAVTDGETGWTYATTFEYDLIVLDVCLPKLDGLSFCQRFREEGYLAPILFLTSQGSSLDKVRGLDAGADDYVVKPFDSDELSARIRALLRRGSASPFPQLAWGDLVLNPSTCEVTYCDRPLTLTTKEYELLELFLRDGHCVYSAEEILDRLWSSEEFPVESTVRSHLRRLRKKLSAAGAPHDFIATLHGRGYYLKSASEDVAQGTVPNPSGVPSAGLSARSPEQEQAYLAFLNETWVTTQAESLAQIGTLSQAIETSELDPALQSQLQRLAHKLAGTLGIFMLKEGTQIALELETMLQKPLGPSVPEISAHLTTLARIIQNTATIDTCQLPTAHAPLLLMVDCDETAAQGLGAAATCAGLRMAIASTKAQVQNWLQPDLNRVQRPDVILLKLSPTPLVSRRQPTSSPFDLDVLQDLTSAYPEIPIVVMGNALELSNRLEVVQRGGEILIEASATPENAIAAVRQCLSNARKGTKVMVVDDDQALLRALPNLLNPWGFKVSTLAAPQQFWHVLEAVNPDALVLDVKMPQINGLELCQILRSDLKWRSLPILFLSAICDLKTQQQAFDVGADDYLCKPVAGADLAHRILNRLRRHQSWAI